MVRRRDKCKNVSKIAKPLYKEADSNLEKLLRDAHNPKWTMSATNLRPLDFFVYELHEHGPTLLIIQIIEVNETIQLLHYH